MVWVPLEADPETKTQMQVVYLEGGPRKHLMESGEVRREGKEATIACVNEQITPVGNWRAVPLGTLRDGVNHAQSHPT